VGSASSPIWGDQSSAHTCLQARPRVITSVYATVVAIVPSAVTLAGVMRSRCSSNSLSRATFE
jgi:hypothetical protein